MVVTVVMVVAIQFQGATRACAKQVTAGGRGGDDIGRAFATEVAVQTDHPIHGRYDDVQFMADHQNHTADIITQGFDRAVKRQRCRLIRALGRFVEHKDLRVIQNRALEADHRTAQTGRLRDRRTVTGHGAAAFADQERGVVVLAGVNAGDKGVQKFDPLCQPCVHKARQGT
jgi:hypothetical protein